MSGPDAGVEVDAAVTETGADAAPDAALPIEPFWSTCGTEDVDFAFIDSGVPLAVGRDGTMYSVINHNYSTVIARKRPGQPAELTWFTVAPQQLYAVEGIAPAPGGALFFTGYVDNVHGLYRVEGEPPIATRLGPVLPSPNNFEILQHTGERLYLVDYQGKNLFLVDLVTGARTVAVHHAGGILHFVLESPTSVLLTSYNAPLTRVTLDASGAEASRAPVTSFGSDDVYKVGVDQAGRLYGMTFPDQSELLERFDPATNQRAIIFGGNLRWSDWTFGRGALRCDLLITSQNSSISAKRPGDQTPAWP